MRWTIVMILLLALVLVAGCTNKTTDGNNTPQNDIQVENSAQADNAVADVNTDLGQLEDVFSDIEDDFEE